MAYVISVEFTFLLKFLSVCTCCACVHTLIHMCGKKPEIEQRLYTFMVQLA